MWGLFEQHDSQFWGGSGSLAPVPLQAILALYQAWLEKPFSLQWLSPPGVVNNIPEVCILHWLLGSVFLGTKRLRWVWDCLCL